MKSVAKKPHSFFKIMFSNSPEKSMRIPKAFMKHFRGSGVPGVFQLKSDGKSWRVATEVKKDSFFLIGGWPNFFKERNLEYGDFLVFKLVEKSVFEVDVYAKSGCEKIPNNEDQGVPSLVKQEVEEIPIKENTANHRKPEVTGENSKKRRKPEGLDEGNAAKRMKNTRISKIDVVPEYEISSGEIPLNHRNSRYHVTIPYKFARETGLKWRTNTLIKDPEGSKRPVSITVSEGKTYLSSGWKDLYKANGLELGSKILLKSNQGKGDEIELQIVHPVKRARNFPEKVSASAKLVVKDFNKYKIVLPRKFAQVSGLRWKKETVVKDPDGRKWGIGIFYTGRSGQTYLGAGWSDLMKENGLELGAKVLVRFNGGGNEIDLKILNRGGGKWKSGIQKKQRGEGKESE